MKYYLVRNYYVKEIRRGHTVYLRPNPPPHTPASPLERTFFKNVIAAVEKADKKHQLEHQPNPSKRARRDYYDSSDSEFDAMWVSEEENLQKAPLEITFGPLSQKKSRVKVHLRGDLIRLLNRHYDGPGDLKLKLALTDLKVDNVDKATNLNLVWNLETEELDMFQWQHEGGCLVCTSNSQDNFATLVPWWNGQTGFSGNLTIEVTDAIKPYCKDMVPRGFNINKMILREGLCSDVVIVAENGALIESHKCFLSAHSPVMKAMFESQLKKGSDKADTLEMPEMTEEGVKALLAYIYHWSTTDAEKNVEIALELFKAAHKYLITSLEQVMKTWLLHLPTESFTGEIGLELYLFSKQLPDGGKELKMKSVQILKTYCEDIEQSEMYKSLFEKDPSAARELCQSILVALKNVENEMLCVKFD